ncbi:hypothetical protein EYF80_064189 [Liparis tanakae]|uniref:Uncharacterized protein n=1 Tax=Liparis tanakae TaxID=230148 RepID=A0A4Z2EAU6_9TELE|nr:hypothetical protein EYF80_064189 [Liparis tanakae]
MRFRARGEVYTRGDVVANAKQDSMIEMIGYDPEVCVRCVTVMVLF